MTVAKYRFGRPGSVGKRRVPRNCLFVLVLACAAPALGQSAERIVEIRVHGNHTTPDAEVLALTGLTVGDEATETRLHEAEQKLQNSHRFSDVEVRRRYLSISDPTQILVVVVVDEIEGISADDLTPGWIRRLKGSGMWLPILHYDDGYGWTYGVRVALAEPLGPHTRISVPLTWGGERRAGFEVERTFERGALSAIRGSLSTYRQVNPHFEIPDVRYEARVRAERAVTRWLRVGASARTARVDFGGLEDRHDAAGADFVVDTRVDPSFPRNAVHASLGWERVGFDDASLGGSNPINARPGRSGAGRWLGDARGYIGVVGSNVLALRAQFALSNAALPPSEQSLLGGGGSLRGYATGYRAGDNMTALSAEVRVPLNSPLSIGRFGAKAFVDAGTTWSSGTRLSNQRFDHGIGGGVYFGVAAITITLDVAWPESGNPRAHFGLGVTF